jgi:hypothetical protein
VDPSNDAGLGERELLRAVQDAAWAWEQSDANVDFVFEGTVDGAKAEYDGENVIFFDSGWDRPEGLLAMAMNWNMADGTILEFDLPINTRDWDWATDGSSSAMDLQNVLTHEFGHVLGLGHVEDEEATMYGGSRAGELEKRSLLEDDEDGARALYGGQALNGQPIACNALPGRAHPFTLLVAASSLLLGLRRRRS